MADDATEVEFCFLKFNAAKVALVRATAHRKAVQTRHSPPWYEAVMQEAACFNATYEAFQALQARLIVPAGEAVMEAGSPTWYLQPIPVRGSSATPT
jgi:hypothetical protein